MPVLEREAPRQAHVGKLLLLKQLAMKEDARYERMPINQGQRRDVVQREIPHQLKSLVEQDQVLRNEDRPVGRMQSLRQIRGDEVIRDEIVAVRKAEIAAPRSRAARIARQS